MCAPTSPVANGSLPDPATRSESAPRRAALATSAATSRSSSRSWGSPPGCSRRTRARLGRLARVSFLRSAAALQGGELGVGVVKDDVDLKAPVERVALEGPTLISCLDVRPAFPTTTEIVVASRTSHRTPISTGLSVSTLKRPRWRDPDSTRGHHDFGRVMFASELAWFAGHFVASRDAADVRVSRPLRPFRRRYGRRRPFRRAPTPHGVGRLGGPLSRTRRTCAVGRWTCAVAASCAH